MNQHPVFEALRYSADACACAALRKATRATTQMYDRIMEPSGLTNAQFSLLAALYYAGNIPIKKLASRLVMDRTSLTRTLAPLEKRGLVNIGMGETDRRVRVVSISALGLETLISALPLWQSAQEKMEGALGEAGWKELRASLQNAVTAVKVASGNQASINR